MKAGPTLLTLVLLAAPGCLEASAPAPAGSPALAAGMCAQLALNTSAFEAPLGQLIWLNGTLRNCGTLPIEWGGGGRCGGGGPHFFLQNGNDSFDLYDGSPDGTPVNVSSYGGFELPCPPIMDRGNDLQPRGVRQLDLAWNGTLGAFAPCTTAPDTNGTTITCGTNLTSEPARRGVWQVGLSWDASDGETRFGWTATRSLTWD